MPPVPVGQAIALPDVLAGAVGGDDNQVDIGAELQRSAVGAQQVMANVVGGFGDTMRAMQGIAHEMASVGRQMAAVARHVRGVTSGLHAMVSVATRAGQALLQVGVLGGAAMEGLGVRIERSAQALGKMVTGAGALIGALAGFVGAGGPVGMMTFGAIGGVAGGVVGGGLGILGMLAGGPLRMIGSVVRRISQTLQTAFTNVMRSIDAMIDTTVGNLESGLDRVLASAMQITEEFTQIGLKIKVSLQAMGAAEPETMTAGTMTFIRTMALETADTLRNLATGMMGLMTQRVEPWARIGVQEPGGGRRVTTFGREVSNLALGMGVPLAQIGPEAARFVMMNQWPLTWRYRGWTPEFVESIMAQHGQSFLRGTRGQRMVSLAQFGAYQFPNIQAQMMDTVSGIASNLEDFLDKVRTEFGRQIYDIEKSRLGGIMGRLEAVEGTGELGEWAGRAGRMKAALMEVKRDIQLGFMDMMTDLIRQFTGAGGFERLEARLRQILGMVRETVREIFDWIRDHREEIVEWIVSAAEAVLQVVARTVSAVQAGIRTVMENFEQIKATVGEVLENIKPLVMQLFAWAEERLAGVLEKMADFFESSVGMKFFGGGRIAKGLHDWAMRLREDRQARLDMGEPLSREERARVEREARRAGRRAEGRWAWWHGKAGDESGDPARWSAEAWEVYNKAYREAAVRLSEEVREMRALSDLRKRLLEAMRGLPEAQQEEAKQLAERKALMAQMMYMQQHPLAPRRVMEMVYERAYTGEMQRALSAHGIEVPDAGGWRGWGAVGRRVAGVGGQMRGVMEAMREGWERGGAGEWLANIPNLVKEATAALGELPKMIMWQEVAARLEGQSKALSAVTDAWRKLFQHVGAGMRISVGGGMAMGSGGVPIASARAVGGGESVAALYARSLRAEVEKAGEVAEWYRKWVSRVGILRRPMEQWAPEESERVAKMVQAIGKQVELTVRLAQISAEIAKFDEQRVKYGQQMVQLTYQIHPLAMGAPEGYAMQRRYRAAQARHLGQALGELERRGAGGGMEAWGLRLQLLGLRGQVWRQRIEEAARPGQVFQTREGLRRQIEGAEETMVGLRYGEGAAGMLRREHASRRLTRLLQERARLMNVLGVQSIAQVEAKLRESNIDARAVELAKQLLKVNESIAQTAQQRVQAESQVLSFRSQMLSLYRSGVEASRELMGRPWLRVAAWGEVRGMAAEQERNARALMQRATPGSRAWQVAAQQVTQAEQLRSLTFERQRLAITQDTAGVEQVLQGMRQVGYGMEIRAAERLAVLHEKRARAYMRLLEDQRKSGATQEEQRQTVAKALEEMNKYRQAREQAFGQMELRDTEGMYRLWGWFGQPMAMMQRMMQRGVSARQAEVQMRRRLAGWGVRGVNVDAMVHSMMRGYRLARRARESAIGSILGSGEASETYRHILAAARHMTGNLGDVLREGDRRALDKDDWARLQAGETVGFANWRTQSLQVLRQIDEGIRALAGRGHGESRVVIRHGDDGGVGAVARAVTGGRNEGMAKSRLGAYVLPTGQTVYGRDIRRNVVESGGSLEGTNRYGEVDETGEE